MAIQIKLKNSVVQDSTPSTSDLPAVGEIALNANINSIGGFMRASDNTIVKIFGPGSLSTPTATTTVSGISELATNAETTTGTATNRVVTPAGLNAVTVAERTTSNTNYVAKAGSTLTGVLHMPNGSNSAPSINFGDSDSGIFGGSNTVSLAAGGTTRLTADTGVSVTGTLAVTGAITSTSDLTIADKIIHAGDTNTAVRFPAADTVSVETGGSEAIRVDSSQRLLVGTSSSNNVAGFGGSALQVEGLTGATSSMSLIRHSANDVGSTILFSKSRGTSNGATTIVQNNDIVARIFAYGADGTDTQSQLAGISYEVDGTPGANDMPGRLVFSTTADGASSSTTRLTIDSAGLVKLPDNGKFVAGAGSDLQIYHEAGAHSFIKNTSGRLRIIGAGGTDEDIQINAKDGEFSVRAIPHAQVELYYDNSKKFETTSSGISVSGSVAADGLAVGDAELATFGNSADLVISHGGTDSTITNNTGQLKIAGDTIRITNAAVSETQALFTANGAAELYYDNSKKLETTSTGVSIPGILQMGTSSSYIDLPDNASLYCGTGDDLRIFHDGTSSIIKNITGGLFVQSDDTRIVNAANSETIARFIADGAVELYHNSSKKLETTSAGATVTGTLTATSFSGDGSNLTGVSSVGGNTGVKFNDDVNITLGTGNDTLIRHVAGSHTEINHVGSGDLILETVNGGDDIMLDSNDDIFLNHAGESMIVCRSDAQVELYYDNSKKFETTSNGATFLDNVRWNDNKAARFGGGDDLQIYHDGTNSFITNATNDLTINSTGDDLILKAADDAVIQVQGSENAVLCNGNGAVELYYDNSKKLSTISGGVQIHGNLAIQDGYQLRLGNDNDAQFYHSGSNCILSNSTGLFYLGNYSNTNLIFQTNNTNRWAIQNTGHFVPDANNTVDIGTSSTRVRNIYTNDLNLSNEGSSNDVDATWGSYTIQEGAEDLFLINRRSGKKYKFNLTEVA